MIECNKCGFWNNNYGACTCPSPDMWYACPIENKKPENIQSLKEHTEWLPEYQGKWVAESEHKK